MTEKDRQNARAAIIIACGDKRVDLIPKTAELSLLVNYGIARYELKTLKPENYLRVRGTLNTMQNVPIYLVQTVNKLEESIGRLSINQQLIVNIAEKINEIPPFTTDTAEDVFVEAMEAVVLDNLQTGSFPPKSVDELVGMGALQILLAMTNASSIEQFNFFKNVKTYNTLQVKRFRESFSLPHENTNIRQPSEIGQYVRLLAIWNNFAEHNQNYIDPDALHIILFSDYFSAVPEIIRRDLEIRILLYQQTNIRELSSILQKHGISPEKRSHGAVGILDQANILQPLVANADTSIYGSFTYDSIVNTIRNNAGSVEIPLILSDGSPAGKIVAASIGARNFIEIAIVSNDGAHILFLIDNTGSVYGIDKNKLRANDGDLEKVRKMVQYVIGELEKFRIASNKPARRGRKEHNPPNPPKPDKRPIQPVLKPNAGPVETTADRMARLSKEQAERHAQQVAARATQLPISLPSAPIAPIITKSEPQAPIDIQTRIENLIGKEAYNLLIQDFISNNQADVFIKVFEKYFNGQIKKREKLTGIGDGEWFKSDIVLKRRSYRVITRLIEVNNQKKLVIVDVYAKVDDTVVQHRQRVPIWLRNLGEIIKYYNSKK